MSTPDDDFDWRDAESVVVRYQPAIAVYTNPFDAVVIRQEGNYGPDEDQWICITKENVLKVVRAMLEVGGVDISDLMAPTGKRLLLPKPEPLSGAERQRRYRSKHRDENGDARAPESDGLPLRHAPNGHAMELAS